MLALNAGEQQSEDDDISEPDEDTLVGQMATMRGGKVKRRDEEEEEGESEEESSGTDDDKDSDSDSEQLITSIVSLKSNLDLIPELHGFQQYHGQYQHPNSPRPQVWTIRVEIVQSTLRVWAIAHMAGMSPLWEKHELIGLNTISSCFSHIPKRTHTCHACNGPHPKSKIDCDNCNYYIPETSFNCQR